MNFDDKHVCICLGERLKAIRVCSGKSVTQVSNKMGLPINVIVDIENGDCSCVTQRIVERYVKACDFNMTDFSSSTDLAGSLSKLSDTLRDHTSVEDVRKSLIFDKFVVLLVKTLRTMYCDLKEEEMSVDYLKEMLDKVLEHIDNLGSVYDEDPIEDIDGCLMCDSMSEIDFVKEIMREIACNPEMQRCIDEMNKGTVPLMSQ